MRPDHTGEYVALLILIVGLIALCALQAAAYHTMPAGRHRAPRTWADRRQDLRDYARLTYGRTVYATMGTTLAAPRQDELSEVDEWIAAMHRVVADEFTGPPVGGVGRYAHLRTDEMDATAERELRLAERGLRPVSVWGTPVDVDVWEMAA